MVKLTRAQRVALKAVYDRKPILLPDMTRLNYRDFRKYRVHETFYMDDAIVVSWCGMFLAIEKDGYTHS